MSVDLRRLVLCVSPKLMAGIQRASAERESSVSEYVRVTLRQRLEAEAAERVAKPTTAGGEQK